MVRGLVGGVPASVTPFFLKKKIEPCVLSLLLIRKYMKFILKAFFLSMMTTSLYFVLSFFTFASLTYFFPLHF